MRIRRVSVKIAPLVLAALPCCSRGGRGGAGDLEILGTNITPGQVLPINAQIEIRFNKPLDLATVNFGSISIVPAPPAAVGAPSAGPAQGTFFLDPRSQEQTVVFQPDCPTDPASQNGGLLPGNSFGPVSYTVTVQGRSSARESLVKGKDGSSLQSASSFHFQTPSPPSAPFLDPNPLGPPKVLGLSQLPSILSKNLLINPLPPLLLTLDQSVLAPTVDNDSVRMEFTHPATGQETRIPARITLFANCTESGHAILSVTPLGVLPPSLVVRFFLSKKVQGLGIDDANASDLLFHAAPVEDAFPVQRDAILETFDADDQMDPAPSLIVPLARWGSGILEAAPAFPGAGSQAEIEIGPATSNGKNVVFSTDGGTLKDKNGTAILFPNGVIEVKSLVLKDGSPGNTLFQVVGSNPLIVRCSEKFVIEANAQVSLDGQSGSDVSGICTANLPVPGGSGNAGGGDGGQGSPEVTRSSSGGEDGNGPFNLPGTGGKGGNSGYGKNDTCGGNIDDLLPGGGGGGNWGTVELSGDDYGTFCYSPIASPCFFSRRSPYFGCPWPLSVCPASSQVPSSQCDRPRGAFPVINSFGEDGSSGVATSRDALSGLRPAKGGKAGPAIFVDGIDQNNFLGRKPSGAGVTSGELATLLGGEGAGAGGDTSAANNYPPANFLVKDSSGGAGGGGAGALLVQCLGPIEVRGILSANGGRGGEGELLSGAIGNGAGGGGGGAGGMIVLESASSVRLGIDAVILARGGLRGYGYGTIPTPDPPFPLGGPMNGCAFGRTNPTASKGGAGGKGLIQIHVPFSPTSTVNCDLVAPDEPSVQPGALKVQRLGDPDGDPTQWADILCERDPLLTAKADPDPHALIARFGPRSAARSRWFYTGQAKLHGPPRYEFGGTDESGFALPAAPQILVIGSGGVVSQAANSVILDNQTLAALAASEPRTLLSDLFQPAPASAVFPIVNAAVSGSLVTILTDAAGGPLPAVSEWQVHRPYFQTLLDGRVSPLSPNASVRVTFEGADETSPGSLIPDPATLFGPTANIRDSGILGKQMLRFTVEFDMNAQQIFPFTINPPPSVPGIDSLKIPYSF